MSKEFKMKSLILGMTLLLSFTSFAGDNTKCEDDLFEKIYNLEEVQTKLNGLVEIPDSSTIQRDLTEEEVRSMHIGNSITTSIGRIARSVCKEN